MKVKIGKFPNHYFWHSWLYSLFGYSPEQRVKVKIHKYDTWSMDQTLAPIILPMLVQLKATQHGHPANLTEKEWDDILDEMIWAFEQKCRDDWMRDYDYNKWDSDGATAHQKRMTNGFKLFGKYYENLWD
jgi:hypothetical protein|tara:strand:- start:40 stop:429 length:390 start_codon:yes stop_codon:yes gene_type:complete